MINYDSTPKELMSLDVSSLPKEELKELAYYIWAVHEDNPELMIWRKQKLLPLLRDEN